MSFVRSISAHTIALCSKTQSSLPVGVDTLDRLDAALSPADMNLPGYRLHKLKGQLEGSWAVDISGNWRIVFQFEGEDAILVDYLDYH